MRQNCEVDVLLVSKASGVLLCEVKDKGHTWEVRAATAHATPPCPTPNYEPLATHY